MHSINFICQKGHMEEVFWGEEKRGEDCSNSFFFLSIILTHLNIMMSIITKHVH